MEDLPTRIGLLGFFGIGNFGNDASLEAMLLFLTDVRPAPDVTCVCPYEPAVAATFAIPTLNLTGDRPTGRWFALIDRILLGLPRRIATLLHPFRQVRRFDILIIPGTGALDDYGTGPRGWPVALFTWCLAARLRRVNVAFVCVGAGPIVHPLSRWLMKSAAKMATYRSFRDSGSRRYMHGLGLDTSRDAIFPDIVFRLPAPKGRRSDPADSGIATVGVGVMGYWGWRGDRNEGADVYAAYVVKMAEFARWLLGRGHTVRLLTGKSSDDAVVRELIERVADELQPHQRGLLLWNPVASMEELMEEITRTDLVVASRFHNIVAGLMVGAPVISIGYSDKNKLLMSDMGLCEKCQEIESLDLPTLQSQFVDLLDHLAKHKANIRVMNRAYAEQLAVQGTVIARDVLRIR